MRWRSGLGATCLAAVALGVQPTPDARAVAAPVLVHVQRYGMGTMFDLFAWHDAPDQARTAIDEAWREIERLDRVMSHFRDDSDLSRLNREGARGFVTVDPSLVDVVSASLSLTQRTGGRFDITMTPALRVWREAHERGAQPSSDELSRARACIGASHVVVEPPDLIRFDTPCVELDLGGVGKGFAVDRALALLARRGVTTALINAGGSSIGAIGAPPGEDGWRVQIGGPVSGRDVVLLRDASMSTSRLRGAPTTAAPDAIVDPRSGVMLPGRAAVSVVTTDGTTAEALSKALLMASVDEARTWLATFPDTTALWISAEGTLTSSWRASNLRLADAP